MAEVTGSKSAADEASSKPNSAKRRLRTNSETVRERQHRIGAEQEASIIKQSSGRNIFSAFWSGFTWPLRKIGHALARLGRFKVIRIIGRIIFPRYFRNSWKELRLVTWPDRRTSWKLTYAVIIFSVLFGTIVFGVDTVLDKLFKEFIIK